MADTNLTATAHRLKTVMGGRLQIIKTRGHFPTDEAATKLLWLAIRNVLAKTVRPTYDWKGAMNQFAVLFGERFTLARA